MKRFKKMNFKANNTLVMKLIAYIYLLLTELGCIASLHSFFNLSATKTRRQRGPTIKKIVHKKRSLKLLFNFYNYNYG